MKSARSNSFVFGLFRGMESNLVPQNGGRSWWDLTILTCTTPPLEYYQPNSKMIVSKLHKNGKHYSDTHFTTKSNVTSFIDLQKHLSEEPTHWDPPADPPPVGPQWVPGGSPTVESEFDMNFASSSQKKINLNRTSIGDMATYQVF